MSTSPANPAMEGIADVNWAGLAAHHVREGLFLVATGTSLEAVAAAVAADDATKVKGWLEDGSLGRPTDEEVEGFVAEDDGSTRFCFVIVQPFVLAQRR